MSERFHILAQATLHVWARQYLPAQLAAASLGAATAVTLQPRPILGFPAADQLHQKMITGFEVVGEWQATGMFPRKLVEATKSVKDLWISGYKD